MAGPGPILLPVGTPGPMGALGHFLRARRAQLRPSDVGLLADSRPRRVAGLRREELARAAGVSPAYYTRLEQGVSANASDEVLEALARALRLDPDERAHLHDLARPRRGSQAPGAPDSVRPGAKSVLDALADTPAMIVSRSLDVLAWNATAHLLLAWRLPFEAVADAATRPNVARLVFLDREGRDLWVDRSSKARETVSYLRMTAARFPDDPVLVGLVTQLYERSDEFARRWDAHPVADCGSTVRRYQHPLVGPLVLTEEVLGLTDPGQSLVVYIPEGGSPAEASLRLLRQHSERTRTPRSDSGTAHACP